jgi:hypothetical protein
LKPQHLEPNIDEALDSQDEDNLGIPASDLGLGIAVSDWWEVLNGTRYGKNGATANALAKDLRQCAGQRPSEYCTNLLR